jgi:hypothetical protein
MACNKCKKKEQIVDFEKSTEFMNKGVVIFVIIWSLFAIYGIYTLVNNLI